MEETSIRTRGNFAHPYGVALRGALDAALALDPALPDWVLELEGMSGRLYRRLINRLIAGLDGARYLEVGSWAGSTACSAIHGNRVTATCIDNWSEFGGPRETFLDMTARATTANVDFRFIESDFRAVDYSALGTFNVYLFDGPHARDDQYDGVRIAQPALDRTYIQIVDDWNWPYVREGTRTAIKDAGLREVCAVVIRTTQDDSHPEKAIQRHSAWHNGYYLAVLEKA